MEILVSDFEREIGDAGSFAMEGDCMGLMGYAWKGSTLSQTVCPKFQ